jgi:hypothetical protein
LTYYRPNHSKYTNIMNSQPKTQWVSCFFFTNSTGSPIQESHTVSMAIKESRCMVHCILLNLWSLYCIFFINNCYKQASKKNIKETNTFK